MALVFGLTGLSPAWSAARYVEVAYGSDDFGTNDCRSRTSPCASLQQAFSQAGTNDRIYVGPGYYAPVTNFNFQAGQKLLSVAGASSTIIDMRSVSSGFGFLMGFAPRAALGQKRRGFTILADSSITSAILFVNFSDSARVEGNRFVSNVENVDTIIDINSTDRLTIRYNDLYTEDTGTIGTGLNVISLGAGSSKNKRWNISENRLSDMVSCIDIGSTAVNNANKVSKNRLENCAEKGIEVTNYDDTLTFATSSRDKYTDNVIIMRPTNTMLHSGINIIGGSPTISKNLLDVSEGYFDGIVLSSTTRASVRDNILLGPRPGLGAGSGVYGIYTPNPNDNNTDITISGNTIQRFLRGVTVDLLELKALQKNNILQSANCQFDTPNLVPAKPLKARGNFWGEPGVPPSTAGCSGTAAALTAGNLEFSPANRANPVRVKDVFN